MWQERKGMRVLLAWPTNAQWDQKGGPKPEDPVGRGDEGRGPWRYQACTAMQSQLELEQTEGLCLWKGMATQNV